MSRQPVQTVILCEDRQQECFVRRFLLERGVNRWSVRLQQSPRAKGAADQWVRESFPKELRAYRSKCNHLSNCLLAVVDADMQTVCERIKSFEAECEKQNIPFRRDDERVALVVPKRNIETWLAYLRGETVDETTEYRRYENPSDCQPDAGKLAKMCAGRRLEESPPESLKLACGEFQRLVDLGVAF
jgi:hypothetical protein